jgi:hypothetical protein
MQNQGYIVLLVQNTANIIIFCHGTYNLYDITISFQITIHSPSIKETNKR